MISSLCLAALLLTFGFAPFISAGPIWNKELAQTQGFKDLLKTIGTSLCKAAYDDSNPNALAEAMQTWGKVDEQQIERVKDFFNRFGSNLCDYITKDGGSVEKLSAQSSLSTAIVPWPNTWRSLGAPTKAEMQGNSFSNLLKNVGTALCKAAYNKNDPNALAQAFPLMNEAEIQDVKNFLKRFGSILCDSITDDTGVSNKQSVITPFLSTKPFPWLARQEVNKAEMQGFLDLAKKVGTAFCKAAYEGQTPRAIVESLGVTDEIEIQQFTDFLKRFGANLCDYVTGDSEKAVKEGRNLDWATQRETSAEEQGFFRKIGSALCGAAFNRNPTAAAQLFGLTDEAEIQKFTDFLKRFGSNLCNSITDNSRRMPLRASRPALIENRRPTLKFPGSSTLYYGQSQGLKSIAKKVGSALCGAAYNPSAVAESAISQGLMDEADAQQFKDFMNRFGRYLCDYITEDNGEMDAINKQDLAQELVAALQ